MASQVMLILAQQLPQNLKLVLVERIFMAELFMVVNKLLDIKAIQWVLLALCASLILGSFWFTLKYNSLKLEHALLTTETVKIGEALRTQNLKIKELGDQSKVYMDRLLVANSESQKIASNTAKNLRTIAEYTLDENCDVAATQALLLLKGNVNVKGNVK